jgi:hypothetical protein
MGCNCGGVRDGYVEVWRYLPPGGPAVDYPTQAEANAAKAANGGRGSLLRIVKRTAAA